MPPISLKTLRSLLWCAGLWLGGVFFWSRNPQAPLQPWLAALTLAGLIAGGYGALYYGRRAWRLADTPIARIRSAPQGYVELYGQARLMEGPPIIAPLSLLPCAWYRYRVEECVNNRWRMIDSGESDHLFLLEDRTGRCVIDPHGADLIKIRRDVWYGGASGARIHALWGLGAAYRYTEQRLIPGEEIHVLGGFRTVGGLREAPDIRREVAALLECWKRDPQRMALFDRNGNGRIDPDEWEAARRAAEKQVRREWLQQTPGPDIHLLADPEDPARPFIIAAFRNERRLIGYFQWRAAGCLFVAVGAGGFLLDRL